MKRLWRWFYNLKRAGALGVWLGLGLGFFWLWLGGFAQSPHLLVVDIGVGALGLLAMGLAFSRRKFQTVGEFQGDLELGLSILISSFLFAAGFRPDGFPAVFLCLACCTLLFSKRSVGWLCGAAIFLDVPVTLLGQGGRNWKGFVAHVFWMALFAAFYHLVLSAKFWSARRAEKNAIEARMKELEKRALRLRLSGETYSSQTEWLLASVREVDGALENLLKVLHYALRADSAAVFLVSEDRQSLCWHLGAGDIQQHKREPFLSTEGALSAVLKKEAPLHLFSENGLKSLGYCAGRTHAIQALLATALKGKEGVVSGIVLVERAKGAPFQAEDEVQLSVLAQEIQRVMDLERIMVNVRRNASERDRFFRVVNDLNRSSSPEQVLSAIIESARHIAPLDFCAITLVDDSEGKRFHRIARVSGGDVSMEQKAFEDNVGLVASVVRYGVALPSKDTLPSERHVVFCENILLGSMGSIKVFPLTAGERTLGTLVVGSKKKLAIEADGLRMLEVVAISAAQAVLRAQLFEQMEKMATMDGLTGLYNHRTFQVRLDELLSASKRYGRQCSLILFDVDHFKSVNDKYGHPIGDYVLKRIGKLLRKLARDSDIPTRYGGEEFALIMPETDLQGAQVIAERIREAVMAEMFQTEQGMLRVTVSLGVATFPECAKDKAALIEMADKRLYMAKRKGRNCMVATSSNKGASSKLLRESTTSSLLAQ
ncbi:MAG: sensor domain-containing diguanylate cyclase [Cystobacterineae bacterium]|nr:sensor domain-containing diguanylate cyclase [Cystobacterineae bacterium]